MNDFAVVLRNNLILKVSNFDNGFMNLAFDYRGGVEAFIFKNIEYVALDELSTGIFDRYVERNKFLILDKEKDSIVEVTEAVNRITFNLYNELQNATDGDTIVGFLIDKTGNEHDDKICYRLYQWTYSLPYSGPIDEIIYTGQYPEIKTKCVAIESNSYAAAFHAKFLNYQTADGDYVDKRLIRETTILMQEVNREILDAFKNFVNEGLSTGIFNFIQNPIGTFRKEHFVNYKRALEAWLNIFKQNKEKLKNANSREQLYIIAFSLLRYNMMEALTVEEKIGMLEVFAQGNIRGLWANYFSNTPYSEEQIVIGIVKSVTAAQRNIFLQKLIERKGTGETIFEVIDQRIHGDNKAEMANALLEHWRDSNYNPYLADGTYIESRMEQYVYDDLSPHVLTYQSREFLGIYFDNYNFEFVKNSNKINALRTETNKKIIGTHPRYNTTIDKIEYKSYSSTYSIYQPITLADYNFDSAVKLPFGSETDKNSLSGLIPVFYIKFIDDANASASLIASIGLFFDVAFTFTGIGVLTKLRHLRHLPRLVTISRKLEALDVTLDVIEKILLFATNDCAGEDEFCRRLQFYLMCLQLASGGLEEIISRNAVRQSAKRLDELGTSHGYPADFPEDAKKLIKDHAQISIDINKYLDEITDFPAVRNKLITINNVNPDIVHEFSSFFGSKNQRVRRALQEFQADPTLLDEWAAIRTNERHYFHKLAEDRVPLFLKNRRFIKQSALMNTEIFHGVIEATPLRKPPPALLPNDYKFNGKGVHHKNALEEFNPNGVAKISNKNPVGPFYPDPDERYYTARVQLYHPILGWKTKNKRNSTFFPNSWDAEKVQNELAFAYTNRKQKGTYIFGTATDGVKIVFQIENNIIETAYPNF